MQTHSIQVTDGRRRALEVRAELFRFSGVLDVLATGEPDVLIVVCAGHPRPAEWLRALRTAGYDVPQRRRSRVRPFISTMKCSRLAA
jgi:hypothetical protein